MRIFTQVHYIAGACHIAGACLALIFLIGCGGSEQPDAVVEEAGSQTEAPEDTSESARSLPATKSDTLLVEGMPQPINLKLYETPEGLPLQFYTYYPEDVVAQLIRVTDFGETVRFTANMGGVMRDNAMVQLFILPEGITEQDARIIMKGDAENHQSSRLMDDPRYSWSIEEYVIEDPNFVGTYALGRHANHFFQILVGYPPEYGDGFGPRAHLILSEWRWTETDTGLFE